MCIRDSPYTVRGAAATTAALHGRGRKAGKHIMSFTISSLVWLILLIAFVVVEALTVSLVSIWFAAGAVAALIVSGLLLTMTASQPWLFSTHVQCTLQ